MEELGIDGVKGKAHTEEFMMAHVGSRSIAVLLL